MTILKRSSKILEALEGRWGRINAFYQKAFSLLCAQTIAPSGSESPPKDDSQPQVAHKAPEKAHDLQKHWRDTLTKLSYEKHFSNLKSQKDFQHRLANQEGTWSLNNLDSVWFSNHLSSPGHPTPTPGLPGAAISQSSLQISPQWNKSSWWQFLLVSCKLSRPSKVPKQREFPPVRVPRKARRVTAPCRLGSHPGSESTLGPESIPDMLSSSPSFVAM
jgi:hypothetical protein